MGYCPQFGGLIPELTARQTLRIYANIRGLPDDIINQVGNSRDFSFSSLFLDQIDYTIYRRYKIKSVKDVGQQTL